jgi:hypothetical protein
MGPNGSLELSAATTEALERWAEGWAAAHHQRQKEVAGFRRFFSDDAEEEER